LIDLLEFDMQCNHNQSINYTSNIKI